TYAEIESSDMQPFVSLKGQYQSIMPAHVIFQQVDPNPVGYSRYWLQTVIREKLGFEGVIFSDDLSMRAAAAAGGYRQRAQSALNAGCDAILVCNQPEEAHDVLEFLVDEGLCHSPRLGALKDAIPKAGSLKDLMLSDRWQDASRVIANLHG